MNYLNIHTDLLRSESYLGADPVERATWLNLLAWCASQENGGIIPKASEWTDRKWQQLCGVTKEEATLVSDLYHITEDGDLVVNHYPKDKETEVKTKRETAKANGKKGGRPKKKPTSETREKPTLVNSPKTEGKGREGKGKEWNEKNTPHGVSEGGSDSTPSGTFEPNAIPTDEAAQNFARSSGLMISPECVEAWHDSRIASGWTRPQGGNSVPIVDWRADLRAFSRSWQSNRVGKPEAPTPPPKPVAGPEGWEDSFRELIPNGQIPIQWDHVDADLQCEIITILKGGAA